MATSPRSTVGPVDVQFGLVLLVLVLAAMLVLPMVMVVAGWLYGGPGGGPGFYGFLVWLVSFSVLLAVGYRASTRISPARPQDAAQETLRVAYAEGEISAEEFRTRLDVLHRTASRGDPSDVE